MNNITFFNKTKKKIPELEVMKELIEYAVKYEKIDNVIFSIIIVNNKVIRELNNEYRHLDKPTDVITFALEDDETSVIKGNVRLLGDIYISLDKAIEQALEYGHSNLRELSFLMIHGFLHLLGYDHMTEKEEKIMFKKQEAILNEYGITK